MKIVINNEVFPFDDGCKLLKLKHDVCPMKELEDFWEDIVPFTFAEIATKFTNIEQRRIGIMCLGLDRLVKEINPKLVETKTLSKETTWVDKNGELVTRKFEDTYELYSVDNSIWAKNITNNSYMENVYYVKCKDTSTDREYFLWVDANRVQRLNYQHNNGYKLSVIDCIAWTFQTDVPEGGIEKIIRQGDCILVKKKKGVKNSEVRHLTGKEYLTLLELES